MAWCLVHCPRWGAEGEGEASEEQMAEEERQEVVGKVIHIMIAKTETIIGTETEPGVLAAINCYDLVQLHKVFQVDH